MYQITFVNGLGASVTLDVRSGSNSCEQNTQRYNGVLASGGTYTLNTGDSVVCYRRTANPADPSSGLTVWNTFSPDNMNTPTTISL
jgi:hypothetical protein